MRSAIEGLKAAMAEEKTLRGWQAIVEWWMQLSTAQHAINWAYPGA
jgi:hypothetical protein